MVTASPWLLMPAVAGPWLLGLGFGIFPCPLLTSLLLLALALLLQLGWQPAKSGAEGDCRQRQGAVIPKDHHLPTLDTCAGAAAA